MVFRLEIDVQNAQSDVRDRVSRVRPLLPSDTEEPIVQRFDFADRPVYQLALQGEVEGRELRRLA